MDDLSIEHWRRRIDEDRDRLLLATAYTDVKEKRREILRNVSAMEYDLKKLKEVAEG